MKSMYDIFSQSVKDITAYYLLLVEQTKSQRLVGSTNEWVLDNFYMISEQEKLLKVDLRSKSFRKIPAKRMQQLVDLIKGSLAKSHYQLDKVLLFRYLAQVQQKSKDYLSYPEVCALLPLTKVVLLNELATLCNQLTQQEAYHYSPTDKSAADIDKLNESAKQNLLMMNLFNSMKKVTKLPMAELLDAVSYSEQMLKKEKAGMYDQMYDKTKDDYRAQIVRLSARRKMKEYDLVKELVAKADEREEHVGWQLFPPKRLKLRAHLYIFIVVVASVVLACCFSEWVIAHAWLAVLFALVMLIPASQIVIDLFNQVLYWCHKPVNTFKIKFKDGLIPAEYATMVIMPTILKNRQKTVELLEQLEVYYLSNINRASEGQRLETRQQNLYYTLIGDAAAGDSADMPWDQEVVDAGLEKVRELNAKYGAPIFNFVYRRRAYSEGEGCWLGHERKRGALLHFNDLLLGETSEEEKQQRFRCETLTEWRTRVETPITFVITLDTDTQLVLYSAQKLIGAMAHPLNRARLSHDGRRVDAGYGIMQPRVNVDVEVTNKSRYAQLFAGLGGLDVYTTASFELYQDIFNEGSFCGKGIYDLKIFQKVLKGTFPQNLILSHDLIEGCHIRCGLINDVELFDDNPSNYLDDAKRHHRWTRGDWQIISWLGRNVRNERGMKVKNQVNAIGKWKILDNLRRSMLSLTCLLVILVGYVQGGSTHPQLQYSPAWFALAVLLAVASPILFFLMGQITHMPRFNKRYKYYMTLLRGMGVVVYRSVVQFALLPKEAWMYTDAIVRSLYRMTVSHKNLLNWVPSEEAAKSTKGTLGDYLQKFWFNYVCAAIVAVLAMLGQFSVGLLVATLLICIAWVGAPFLMYYLGRKFPQDKKSLSEQETAEVRTWAKDTWHFFDTLITPENNYLIPDNYQLNRDTKTDYKTSPTNIGYSLTAIVSAAELGFIGHEEAVERLGQVIASVEKLEKWHGHLFNWYQISNLNKLPNYFISTCDSGNFVACLYVVKGYLKQHGDPTSDLRDRVTKLIVETDFAKLYNPELDVFSIGYDYGCNALLPYHYNNFASEARLTSFLTVAQGDAPYKHWFCLDKTLVQYKGFKGVASWYGTLFEYFMPLIFLPTYRHTLMDETYSFAVRAQRAFITNIENGPRPSDATPRLPWGISETAYHELDDAQNYKYHAFGVPYLKFQNTTPDRIVISPYSSLMAIGIHDRAVYENMLRFKDLKMYDEMGFFESYDEEDHVAVRAHYAHHQGMSLASMANYLADHCLQRYFMDEPVMRSMETILKEKAQVKPYIDLKVTQYKRFQYSKVQTESDAREFSGIATMPEVGLLSNGDYTVMLNDRGSGFSRFNNIMLNRYRKISAEPYGQFLYVRNLATDGLWCNTYAPLDVMPEKYVVTFASDKIQFLRVDAGIETKTEVTVIKDRLAEIRRVTFTNNGDKDVDLELTSYSEVIMAPHQGDESHRVFNSMNILSEYDAEHQAVILSKGVQEARDSRYFVLHKLMVLDNTEPTAPAALPEYETSRLRFLGRGGSLRHAEVIDSHRTLSNTVGTTLDPIMSMRRRVHVEAGKQVSVVMLTAFGKAREQLIRISEMYNDELDVTNAFETASVFNNMRNSMSLLKGAQMRLYNQMAKYIVQTANLGLQRRQDLAKNRLSQSGLWRFGISGDVDIVLMEIDDIKYTGFAKETMRAFEYLKVHGLAIDVVFINDEQGENREGLNHFIRNIANTEHLWQSHAQAGKVYVLNGSEISDDERTLLRTVASLALTAHDGMKIWQQLEKMEQENLHYQDTTDYALLKPSAKFRVWSSLDFYNQYGGYDKEGRDYVVTNINTPMPWVNVISNPRFGCVVSASMAGFTFAFNAQQFKLTSWSNDIVRDNASEMLLINNQQFVPATARHGQGFSNFDADYDTFKVKVRLFVSSRHMEKYYQIRIENKIELPQTIELGMVYKLVLGMSEEQTARYLYTQWDAQNNGLVVRNVYHPIYGDTRVLLSATESITSFDTDSPNRTRVGFSLVVPAGGAKEVAYVISALERPTEMPRRMTIPMIEEEFAEVNRFWDEKLNVIQVDTPDKSFNYMLNRWYLYQVYSARLFARAGFYQVGGATGFRDQLQDCMSVLYSDPAYARRQILEHAAHQFAEGDVLHWWHESMLLGARTTFSDDYLWLVYVTYQYIRITGDHSILNEQVCFCQAEHLNPTEAERGMNYAVPAVKVVASDKERDFRFEYATLYEHLRRSINRSMSRIGAHGLPLMGCGDWNDGMSRVGVQGKGESVWVAFFLCDLLPKMQELTQQMPGADLSYCSELEAFRTRLVEALQANAWDGDWFLRAYFDNGDPMGSRNNTECQIDLISQAWSILTDVATPKQKESVFKQTDARLVNREHEIIQLLTPAFQHSANHPGYIMRYPEGVRENGGQYTHGAMWYIMAQLKEGRTDMAYFLYSLINPIHRTTTLADVLKYKVEPYCMAADIYSNPQHPGRGGWTWYTGSASWAYKTGIENILGLQQQGDQLTIAPCIPSEWDRFAITYHYHSATYHIRYQRTQPDAAIQPITITLVDDGQEHEVVLK